MFKRKKIENETGFKSELIQAGVFANNRITASNYQFTILMANFESKDAIILPIELSGN